ncbi:DUF5455 family protein [Hydrogenophaga sp. NFH-34]|uniref:DUF5455 family protein n=1 Tax=Hydrogenophaga sp. NFH-34 TaxID=2744446 RepID=UPI001F25E713|nr:DUF5455 family protein [Hydrogenophaga sp. NFH-34]
MPALAALIGAVFTQLGFFLLKLFLARAAIRAVGVTAIIALSVGLVATFNEFLAPLVQSAFMTSYGQFIGLAFPPIAGTCLATIVSAVGAVFVYRLKVRFVESTAGV